MAKTRGFSLSTGRLRYILPLNVLRESYGSEFPEEGGEEGDDGGLTCIWSCLVV